MYIDNAHRCGIGTHTLAYIILTNVSMPSVMTRAVTTTLRGGDRQGVCLQKPQRLAGRDGEHHIYAVQVDGIEALCNRVWYATVAA